VNNTITGMPASFNSIVWTDSTVIETVDAVLWDGAARLMTEIALGAITSMPVYRSPLRDTFSYTCRDEKILFNGAQWAEVSELYLGIVSELPAAFTSTL
jgi:hypothetical protein